MDKPNQIIDPIRKVIYPPPEAIVNQLLTLRAIIMPTIKLYESTEDIRSIQPNLDMLQRGINYLRGEPIRDEFDPELPPEDEKDRVNIIADENFKISIYRISETTFEINVLGIDIEPKLNQPELFGDAAVGLSDMGIHLPLLCESTYEIFQNNPILELYYPEDDSIIKTNLGEYIKTKSYYIEDDFLDYYFLLPEGRNEIEITIVENLEDEIPNYKETYVFKIKTHIHYAQPEEPEEPEPGPEEPDTPPTEGGGV